MAIHFLNADGSLKSVEHKGLVLKVIKNEYYRIMSDVWGYADKAIVWDKATKQPKSVYIRFCDYNWDTPSHAEVDATKSVKAAYRKYLIEQEFKLIVSKRRNIAARIEKGCTVKVVKGRKVPKGTVGKVVVTMMQEAGWNHHRSTALKLGVATSDVMVDVVARNGKVYKNHRDMVWVWSYNCERQDVVPVDEAKALAEATANVDEKLERRVA